jgi:hypothetical protein
MDPLKPYAIGRVPVKHWAVGASEGLRARSNPLKPDEYLSRTCPSRTGEPYRALRVTGRTCSPAHVLTMPTHSAKDISIFKITTDGGAVIMFIRHNSSARSAASVGEGEPYRPCVGVSFELGEPAQLNWLNGRGWTGGLVLSVEQVYDLEFEPMP